jgi:hypothetical protein
MEFGMASKTVSISARLSHEDAEYLSQLKINGATTPSDKLRAIIAEARQKSAQQHDYLGCLSIVQDLISPAADTVKDAENQLQLHSELVTRVMEWLPDVFAYIISASVPEEGECSPERLLQIEAALCNRIFRLIESVLQMGVTKRCPCYNDKLVAESIGPVLDLAQVINVSHKKGESER